MSTVFDQIIKIELTLMPMGFIVTDRLGETHIYPFNERNKWIDEKFYEGKHESK